MSAAQERSWEALAKRVAASKGWIPWIETERMAMEADKHGGNKLVFSATFKRRTDPDRCPHCGGSLGWSSSRYEFVYVSEPRNVRGWAEDCEGAWKDLVLDYCDATRVSSPEELELLLTAAGF